MDHNNEDVGKCEEDMSECDNTKTTFAIDSRKTVNGFYPLEITLNGFVKGKKYREFPKNCVTAYNPLTGE